MKLTEKIIRCSLVFVILLSFFLSWRIWTNSSNKHTREITKKSIETVQERKASEIFVPTKLVWHQKNQSQMTNRESLIDACIMELKKLDYIAFSEPTVISSEYYNALIRKNDCAEFSYPDKISVGKWAEALDLNIEESNTAFYFNRVILSFREKKIYLVETTENKLIEIVIENETENVEKLIADASENFFAVTNQHDVLPYIYYLENEIRLKQYSYLAARQPFSNYTQAFFADNDVRANNDTEDLTYSDSSGEYLKIENETGLVRFAGEFHMFTDQEAPTDLLSKSFVYLSRTGTTFGNLRYFDSLDTAIIYRNYVEGYPVFGSDGKGAVKIGVSNQGDVDIITNVETIQVPIPSEQEVFLEDTAGVIKQLLLAGADKNKIIDVQIGYTWKNNQEIYMETNAVIDLTPEWYVSYDHEWLAFSQLIENLTTEGSE